MLTVRQSTLPSLWWEKPETSVVPISEKWTAALAAAGAMPAARSSVDEVTPYAMPREPSTSWAKQAHDAEDDEVAHGEVPPPIRGLVRSRVIPLNQVSIVA